MTTSETSLSPDRWAGLYRRILELVRSGQSDAVEKLLVEAPELRVDEPLLIDCIYAEFCTREGEGESLSVAEYHRRFPEFSAQLSSLFEVHRALEISRQGGRSSEIPVGSTRLDSVFVPARYRLNGGTDGEVSQIGEYVVLCEIARGGGGVVYQARHLRLGRLAAVKVLRSGNLADADEVQRFKVEAQAVAQLDHEGIVTVYEVGEDEGRPFIAMAYVDGESLWHRVREAPIEPRAAAKLMCGIADAVQYAHDRGIIHRDLKPSNILVTKSGQPKVTDFGLAKWEGESENLTMTGAVLGTPGYMPPEQASGKTHEMGPAVDIYALGATLYFMLTGRAPFQSATVMETLKQVIEQEPVPPRQLNPAIPRDLETICLKCLQKQQRNRYGSAQGLADDLFAFLQGHPIAARPAGRGEVAWRWVKRNPMLTGLIGLTATAIVVLFIGLYYRGEAVSARLSVEIAQNDVKAATELAQVQEYYSALSSAREKRAARKPGWTWECLEDVKKAAALFRVTGNEKDMVELRSIAAACLSSPDVRFVRKVGPIGSASLAFSTDGKRLAIGELKYDDGIRAQIIDLSQPDQPKILVPPTLLDNLHGVDESEKEQWRAGRQPFDGMKLHKVIRDGFNGIAFSPDGRYLAGGSRHGQVHVWDLSVEPPVHRAWGLSDVLSVVRFHSDGSILYALAGSNVIRRYDVSSNLDELAPLTCQGHVKDFSVSPDGKLIAVVADILQMFDAQTLEKIHDWNEGRRAIAWAGCVAFSGNGKYLAAVLQPDECHIIDVRSGATCQILVDKEQSGNGHGGEVRFAADDKLLCVMETDNNLRIWDLSSGAMISRFNIDQPYAFESLSVNDVDRFITTGAEDAAHLFEFREPEIVHVVGPAAYEVPSALWIDKTNQLVTTGKIRDDMLRVDEEVITWWDAETGTPVNCTIMYGARWPSVDTSHGGSLSGGRNTDRFAVFLDRLGLCWCDSNGDLLINSCLYSALGQPAAFEYPLTELKMPTEIDPAAPERHIVKLGKKKSISEVTISSKDFELEGDEEILWNFWASLRILNAVLDRPTFLITTTHQSGGKYEFTVPAYRLQDGFQLHFADFYSRKDTPFVDIKIAVAEEAPDDLEIHFDKLLIMPLNERVGDSIGVAPIGPIGMSPQGDRIWGITDHSTLNSWVVNDPIPRTSWRDVYSDYTINEDIQRSLDVGESLIALGARHELVHLISPETGQPLSKFDGPGGSIQSISLSRDERQVAMGTLVGHVAVRDLSTSRMVTALNAHDRSVESIEFSPDGTTLASGSMDRTIRLHRIHANQLETLIVLDGLSGEVRCLAFDRTGHRLASTIRGEHAVRVWNLAVLKRRLTEMGIGW